MRFLPNIRLTAPLILVISLSLMNVGCDTDSGEIERPEGWDAETHSDDVAPNYELIFDLQKVHTLHITIDAQDFAEMTADVQAIAGQSGAPGEMAGQMPGGRGQMPGMTDPMAGGDAASLFDEDPMYVPVTIEYDGDVWTDVGMRYKGNSTLQQAISSGNGKIPFRLNLDYWEDEVPEIKNQRFHGFDKITFASGYADDSNLRDTLAAEIFRANGIPAARTAFYRVVVDVGEGDTYWGLYTMIEDPSDDAMLDHAFESHDGNMYKPDGVGADWTVFDVDGFEKKNNEDAEDYSDVEAAVAALHAEGLTDEQWRAGLEEHLDVESFLRWLAVNTVMKNWDVYGALAHNYYLYADPARDGKLVWIPWDHNHALSDMTGMGSRATGAAELLHTSVSSAEWPLITRLLADPVYNEQYRQYARAALDGPMGVDAFRARAEELHELIAPHMVGEDGESSTHTNLSSERAFEESVDELVEHVESRHELVESVLGGE